jgi:hypothetical protein
MFGGNLSWINTALGIFNLKTNDVHLLRHPSSIRLTSNDTNIIMLNRKMGFCIQIQSAFYTRPGCAVMRRLFSKKIMSAKYPIEGILPKQVVFV